MNHKIMHPLHFDSAKPMVPKKNRKKQQETQREDLSNYNEP